MKQLFTRAFTLWLPFLVAVTGICGFSYLVGQQVYRQSANDPQIQMAEDAAASLAHDYTPASVVPRGVAIDLRSDLAPWVTVYDASGTPIESNALLDGAPPRLPVGLFDPSGWVPQKRWQAPSGPETRVSWQPRSDVRHAVVLVQFQAPRGVGYVAVGRSMRLTEERVVNLTSHAAVAWGVTALATFVVIFILLALGWL